MVFQQTSNFGSVRRAGRRVPRDLGGPQSALASLRGAGYEKGRAMLSPLRAQPALPTVETAPFEKGAWKSFSEGALLQLQSEYRAVDHEQRGRPCTWTDLCDHVGFHPSILLAFNPEQEGAVDRVLPGALMIFLPTAGEVLFFQLAQRKGLPVRAQEIRDSPEAVARANPGLIPEFRKQKDSGRVGIVAAARERAAGKTGRAYSYGAERFHSRNERLKGGRGRTEVDGHAERQIAWGAGNKCNVYVNDALDHAGKDTPMSSRSHYATAGQMFWKHSAKTGEPVQARHYFEEVPSAERQPGDIFVRYGGSKANDSHTEVITGVVDDHSFFATGAHGAGSYERHYFTDRAAYKVHVDKLAAHARQRYDAEQIPEAPSLDDLAERHRIRHVEPDGFHFLRHRSIQA